MALNVELPIETIWATARLAVCRPGACTNHDLIFMLCFLFSMRKDVFGYLLPYSRLLLVQRVVLVSIILRRI